MSTAEQRWASDLKNRVDELLKEAKSMEWPGDAINWGSLHCCMIEKVREIHPEYSSNREYVLVTVEEADAPRLASWLNEKLSEEQTMPIEVSCAW